MSMLVRFTFLLLLSAFSAAAEIKPAQDDFLFSTEAVRIPERGMVMHSLIISDGFKIRFLPPTGWKIESNPASKRLTLTAPDLKAALTLDLNSAWRAAKKSDEELKTIVQTRFPDARITSRFRCFTSGGEGTGFEFERTLQKSYKLVSKFVFVPYDGGVVELHLTGPRGELAKYDFQIGCLLTSMAIDKINARAPASLGRNRVAFR